MNNIKINIKRTFSFTLFFIIILSIFGFWGCSSNQTKSDKTPAEILYKEAEQYVARERYLLATEKLNTLRSQFPYSYYATHAELLIADILFLQKSYIEAAASYMAFKELHPKHEKYAYVLWKIAESYYNQLPDTYDRDLSASVEAVKYYSEVINKYPTSTYLEESKRKLTAIEDMLMKRDIYIADFYYKTDVFDSARYRYLDIVDKYKDKKIQDYGMIRVVKSSFYMNSFDECVKYANEYSSKISSDVVLELEDYKKKCISASASASEQAKKVQTTQTGDNKKS
ncbi:MAG: outer membrane protein assembly factor BamD [Oligoflexia bacterium]|nr:outer membrane protein assembly factor BamD [Oligoflexia bacterium]